MGSSDAGKKGDQDAGGRLPRPRSLGDPSPPPRLRRPPKDVQTFVARRLEEALEPGYLRYRARSVAYFADGLERVGVPVVRPPGGHAVFIDAGRLAPHIPADQFPGQAVAVALYEEGGVRTVEIGSLMFPAARLQLVRLAVPRRVYTQSHLEYVAEIIAGIAKDPERVPGYRITHAPPVLRHFKVLLEQVPAA